MKNAELKAQMEAGLITQAEYLNLKTPEKHNHAVIFGRKVDGCPRCEELKLGAKVTVGWGALRKQQEACFRRDLRAHDCKKSNCGPVCTFGDW
jgi:hypothetical protein